LVVILVYGTPKTPQNATTKRATAYGSQAHRYRFFFRRLPLPLIPHRELLILAAFFLE
jgi:hypothetical protein